MGKVQNKLANKWSKGFGSGWWAQSQRHSLSARGIKTGEQAADILKNPLGQNALFMKNQDVADMFAEGATSGSTDNLFIEGDTIYSYGHHFPIARRIGQNKFLFTTKGYSQTTSVHKGRVMRALERAGYDVALVEDVTEDLPLAAVGEKTFGEKAKSAGSWVGQTVASGLFSPYQSEEDAVESARQKAQADAAYQREYALDMARTHKDIEWELQDKSFTDPDKPLPSIISRGKKVHTAKFDRCVKAVSKKSKGKVNPYAVCSASLKYEENILPSHRRKKL